jgi:hypothetical protein
MPNLLDRLLDTPALARLRRNHGLEHAAIHVFTARHPGRPVAGHSDPAGFWLFGELSTEEVRQSVEDALGRLRSGERHLAVHPNCGTNLVTSGVVAGLAAGIAMAGAGPRPQQRLERLPLAGLLAAGALLIARPLGPLIQQRITTSGDPAGLEILNIRRTQRGGMAAHRVSTRS